MQCEHAKDNLEMNPRGLIFLLLALLLLSTADFLQGQVDEQYVKNARQFITLLVEHEYQEAVDYFDADMRQSLSSEQLQEMWKGVQKQFGDYQEQLSTTSQTREGLNIVFVTCEFSKKKIDMQIAFRSDMKIAGLWIVPTEL
jgi:hypothetical protein